MKELTLFKSLLDDEMIDFNALLIKNYKKLNINEKDIIVLSHLSRQEAKGYRTFNPAKMRSKVALDKVDLDQCLTYLTSKGYIEIRLETNPKTLKECEMFSLDNIYNKCIELYTQKEEVQTGTFIETIVDFYEEIFSKQITPNEIEIVRNWYNTKEFTLEEIKNEIIDQSKVGHTSLKYVDQALVKKKLIKRESPEYKEANQVIEELKRRWKK